MRSRIDLLKKCSLCEHWDLQDCPVAIIVKKADEDLVNWGVSLHVEFDVLCSNVANRCNNFLSKEANSDREKEKNGPIGSEKSIAVFKEF